MRVTELLYQFELQFPVSKRHATTSSGKQASRRAQGGPEFSISNLMLRMVPKIGLQQTLCKTIKASTKPQRLGPRLPIGSHRWPVRCIKWPKTAQMAQTTERPVRSVRSETYALYTTTERRADGTFWAMGDSITSLLRLLFGLLGPFGHPKTPFEAHHGPKPLIRPYLGLRGSNYPSTVLKILRAFC